MDKEQIDNDNQQKTEDVFPQLNKQKSSPVFDFPVLEKVPAQNCQKHKFKKAPSGILNL